MKVKYIIAQLQSQGWYLARCRGSHRLFKHDNSTFGAIAVPGKFNAELKVGICQQIQKRIQQCHRHLSN